MPTLLDDNEIKELDIERSRLSPSASVNLSKSEINEDIITLNPTILSNKILGFGDEIKYIDCDYTSIDANRTWDLRLHDKLLLYIKNINDDPISSWIFLFNKYATPTAILLSA